ncbi:MAG: LemA family protein [bacterium]|nr:LemA family protein [bacterium]
MALLLIIGAIIVVLLLCVGVYNGFIHKRNFVHNAWSDIDVQLKRRYDLIPNLVEVVKGYMGHEKSVLEGVTVARTAALSANTIGAKEQAENILTGALKSLFAVSENYPNLKASDNFLNLQNQLATIENDLQSARRYYNATVRQLNIAIQTFPASVFARVLGFKEEPYFQAEEKEREVVKAGF